MHTDYKILKRPMVQTITGLSRSGIYALMASKGFPSQVKLSTRAVGWLEHEVQEWLKNRVSASRQGGANENALYEG